MWGATTVIHNARVQLLATAFNNIGVGSVIAGFVAPMVNGTLGGPWHVGAWLLGGAVLLTMAQLLLGRLR